MIKRDYHVHLHGCLTAQDLWQIGKDIYTQRNSGLEWYACEYEKAWGYKPDYNRYWNRENGLELLKDDYIFDRNNPFNRFQACFNLIVALCPITADDFGIQEKIIRTTAKHGLEYFQARTLIPIHFDKIQVDKYLEGLCSKVRDLNHDLSMETKLVFSLFRDNALAKKHYKQLRDFITLRPELGCFISGIDFAFNEEGYSPSAKKDLFQLFHADNKTQQPLELLYHVGESFGDKSIASAIRWVWEVNQLGATRLGHAIALGVHPENYRGKVFRESQQERQETICWLRDNKEVLKEHGYLVDLTALNHEEKSLRGCKSVEIIYNDHTIDDTRRLQIAVCSILREEQVIIESCPTSNLRIGQLNQLQYHPLKLFHDQGIHYLICTDDPGLFNIDWSSEYHFAQLLTEPSINTSVDNHFKT